MDNIIKDKVSCVDREKKLFKYKIEEGKIFLDKNLLKLSKKYFSSIKDANFKLTENFKTKNKNILNMIHENNLARNAEPRQSVSLTKK